MKVFIIDIIGVHSGGHYYTNRFKDILKKKYGNVNVISNYIANNETKTILLENFYRGNIFRKLYRLTKTLVKYYFFVFNNRKEYFIFLSYGKAHEIIFAIPLLTCRKKIVDAHDVISLISTNKFTGRIRVLMARFLFNVISDGVIIHSERSEKLLKQLKFKKEYIFIPHFSYDIIKKYDENNIGKDIRLLISCDKINVLFFGFIRFSKGIKTIFDIARMNDISNDKEKFNLIIAGNDPDRIIESLIRMRKENMPLSISHLLRYIKDEELAYLFTKTDLVILPYLEISQSGVFEMAVHFRKPVITSSIDFFKDYLDRFPSFGRYVSKDTTEEYCEIINSIINQLRIDPASFYTESDLEKYYEYKNQNSFLKQIEKIFSL